MCTCVFKKLSPENFCPTRAKAMIYHFYTTLREPKHTKMSEAWE